MTASELDAGPVRVLVVDGDRRVRTSLGRLLELADGITLTGVSLDVEGAVRALEGTEVDVVVMDPRLPDFPAGRALANVIADRWPDIRVVSLNWPEEYLPAAPACVTVAPRTVQPDALLDLLRGSSASTATL
jgi:DNA-binding NtrC family response regulator